MKKMMAAVCIAAWAAGIGVAQAQCPIIRAAAPQVIGVTREGVPIVVKDMSIAVPGTTNRCSIVMQLAQSYAVTNIFLLPFGKSVVGLSSEVERELQAAEHPLCWWPMPQGLGGDASATWNEDKAELLAVRAQLIHRDSRKLLGARSMKMFASLDELRAACRSLVFPMLPPLKARLELRDPENSLLGYAIEHPWGGKMKLEVRTMKDAGSGKFILFLSLGPADLCKQPQPSEGKAP